MMGVGISYILRSADGTIKIGFTAGGPEGLRGRYQAHRSAERARGEGDPLLLAAFESSSVFDRGVIRRLAPYRTKRGADWFAPTSEVVETYTRFIEAARVGIMPEVYVDGEVPRQIIRIKKMTGITISRAHAVRIDRIRQYLIQFGLNGLPEKLRPKRCTSICLGTAMEALILRIEQELAISTGGGR